MILFRDVNETLHVKTETRPRLDVNIKRRDRDGSKALLEKVSRWSQDCIHAGQDLDETETSGHVMRRDRDNLKYFETVSRRVRPRRQP